MRRVVAIVLLVLLAGASRADAWGFVAHKFIVDRAIALLPPAMRPFFEAGRAQIVERSIDPDTWRSAGFASLEDENHFLDFDWEGFGPFPFSGLPRDYTAAVAKFGRDRMRESGRLPWRIEEAFGDLRRAFEDYPRRSGSYGREMLGIQSAWLAHYVSDAEVPFHATANHDGQLTGQNGLHARFESTQFERFQARLKIAPPAMAPITDPRDWAFATLLSGQQLVAPILKADLNAIGSRDVYDDAYFEAFFQGDGAILERRVNEAIAAVAAMIAGAWEAAGKPALPVTRPEPPQRKRR